ncbi:MAG: beta-galactosidase [Bacteroidales bacterium]
MEKNRTSSRRKFIKSAATIGSLPFLPVSLTVVMKKLMWLLAFISLIISSCQPPSNLRGNLIVNPGFEIDSGYFPAGWVPMIDDEKGTFRFDLTREKAHSGDNAIEIGRVWSEAWGMNGFKTDSSIPVDPTRKYILSFWYRTNSIDEYPIPLVCRFMVNRDQGEPLRYSKFLSTRDDWTKISWVLDTLPEDAVSTDLMFFLWIRTKGTVIVDDVDFRMADESDIRQFESWRRISGPSPEGDAGRTAYAGSGYFRVEKDANRWWLVNPEGRATWAIASMGEIPGSKHGNSDLKLADWFIKEYGENRLEYARMQYELLESWGFNSFAGWTVGEFAKISSERHKKGENYMPLYRVLNFSIMGPDKDYYVKDNKGNYKGVHDHSFPDPFNPQWRRDAREKAESSVREYRDKPWFAGWFMDNEIDYSSLFRYVWGDYSAKEFIQFLENKYKDINDLNEAWTSTFGSYLYDSFNDILNDKPEPLEWDDPLFIDFTAFERIMMEEYITYTYDLVRELDPHHLLISNRLNLGPMMCLHRTIDLWSRYDVICVNVYPQNLFIGYSKGELEILDWIHEKTGKPLIIGEWSVPAMDSELYDFGKDPYDRPLDWSWPQVMKNQSERGEAYRTCMMQLASKPYMIGAGWFKVLDVNSTSRRANRGLINSEHRVYSEMTGAVSSTNNEIKEKLNLPQ